MIEIIRSYKTIYLLDLKCTNLPNTHNSPHTMYAIVFTRII